jgi:EmrB/QacA subfamily drug resistance transporter
LEYKWTVLTVTSVGVVMSGIDSRILIIGLPQVATVLHADAEQAVWFTQAYVFGSTITLLLIGRFADMVGRVKIYVAGFVIFTVGSILTSISLVPDQVIFFRGVQGLGSAMLAVNSAALLVDVADGKDLGLILGLNAIAFRTGTLLGLTLSGLILAFLDWRALFYLNIPIGIFGTYWARKRLRETLTFMKKRPPMDWIGFGTFTAAVSCLLLGLTYSAYGFTSPVTTVLIFLISLGTFAAFVIQERRTVNPLLDLTLFQGRRFTAGSIAIFVNATAWGAVLILLSLYLQIVRGMSPLEAGLSLIPFELAVLLVGPLSGRLSDRYGRVPFTVAGLAVQTGAIYLFSTLTPDVPFQDVSIYMAMFGLGTGLFNSPITSSIMESVPIDRRGIATAASEVFWYIGYTISLNVAIILMTTVIPFHLLSEMISSVNSSASTTQVDAGAFAGAIRRAYLVLSVMDGIAIIPAATTWRPSRHRGSRVSPSPDS